MKKLLKYLSYHQTYANVSIRSSEINGGEFGTWGGGGQERKGRSEDLPKERAPVREVNSLHEQRPLTWNRSSYSEPWAMVRTKWHWLLFYVIS